MPAKRVQAPMPARYNSVRAGPHRPFCCGEGTDESIIHAVYNAPQMYPTYIVELELQMEASVQACLSAEVEIGDGPAAKRARTAGGANVGGVALAHRMWARPPLFPFRAAALRHCSDEGRCGFGARRAGKAICDRAEWNRCSQSLGPLVALLQHGMRMAMRTRLLHSARSLWMWRAEGRSFRPMRSGGRPLVALSTAARRYWRPGIFSLTLGKLAMDSAPSGDRRGRCDRAAGRAARWQLHDGKANARRALDR